MLRHNNKAIEVAVELTSQMERLGLNAFRSLAFYHTGSDVRPVKDKNSGGLVYGGTTIITVDSLHIGLKNYSNRDVYSGLFDGTELQDLKDTKISLVEKNIHSKSSEFGQNLYSFRVGIMRPNDNFAFKAILKDVIKKGFKVSAREDNFFERELIKQISRVAQPSK